jgi:hypothetical protein
MPGEAQKFWNHLWSICCDVATVPEEAVAGLEKGDVLPHQINKKAGHGSIKQELDTLHNILAEVQLCYTKRADEEAWNGLVHGPVLACALQPFKDVRVVNVLVNYIYYAFSTDQSTEPRRRSYPVLILPMGKLFPAAAR